MAKVWTNERIDYHFPILNESYPYPGKPIRCTVVMDKFKQHTFASVQGILTPKVFPKCIIKPVNGMGSVGVHGVEPASYELLQEFIEGEEFTVDILAHRSRIITVIPKQRLKVRGGQALRSQTVSDIDIIEAAFDIARKFGVDGPANIQLIRNPAGKVYFIELNPKFSASLILTTMAGVNLPLLYLKLALGMPIQPRELVYQSLMMTRYWDEFYSVPIGRTHEVTMLPPRRVP